MQHIRCGSDYVRIAQLSVLFLLHHSSSPTTIHLNILMNCTSFTNKTTVTVFTFFTAALKNYSFTSLLFCLSSSYQDTQIKFVRKNWSPKDFALMKKLTNVYISLTRLLKHKINLHFSLQKTSPYQRLYIYIMLWLYIYIYI